MGLPTEGLKGSSSGLHECAQSLSWQFHPLKKHPLDSMTTTTFNILWQSGCEDVRRTEEMINTASGLRYFLKQ